MTALQDIFRPLDGFSCGGYQLNVALQFEATIFFLFLFSLS